MDWQIVIREIFTYLIPMGALFGWLWNRLDKKFEKIDQRFDKIDEKFEMIFKELKEIRGDIKILDQRVSRIEGYLAGRADESVMALKLFLDKQGK